MIIAKRFEGKKAIVTGAGFGIGRAIALRLAEEGATVAIFDVNGKGAAETVELIESIGGKAIALHCDIQQKHMVEAAYEAVQKSFGPAEILINNAGGMIGTMTGGRLRDTYLDEMEEEGIRLAIDVNLTGTILVTQAALPGMYTLGRGKIVNIASVAGVNGIPRMSIYSAAKGGMIAFTKALAMEVAAQRITVNSIAPGSIWTYGGSPETFLGRTGQPEEVASLAAFLASEESDFITGQNHVIDGGRCLSMRCYKVR